MMPKIDGIALLPELRRTTQAPIFIVSAKGGTDDKVRGLDRGADHYVGQTVRDSRAGRTPAIGAAPSAAGITRIVTFRDLSLDLHTRRAVRDGKSISVDHTGVRPASVRARTASRLHARTVDRAGVGRSFQRDRQRRRDLHLIPTPQNRLRIPGAASAHDSRHRDQLCARRSNAAVDPLPAHCFIFSRMADLRSDDLGDRLALRRRHYAQHRRSRRQPCLAPRYPRGLSIHTGGFAAGRCGGAGPRPGARVARARDCRTQRGLRLGAVCPAAARDGPGLLNRGWTARASPQAWRFFGTCASTSFPRDLDSRCDDQHAVAYFSFGQSSVDLLALVPAWFFANIVAQRTLEPLLNTTGALERFAFWSDFTPHAVTTRQRSEIGDLARAYPTLRCDRITDAFAERSRGHG